MIAAIRENLSTHWEMLVMGSHASAGGRPGSLGVGSGSLPVDTLEAAAASSSNPGLPEMEEVKMGTLGSTDVTIVGVPDMRPIWGGW